MADSLGFRNLYSSRVIAWTPEDNPSAAEIDAVLDDFDRLAFAGLEPQRRCWTAVLHREGSGGCHVHVLAARVDLATGKSLNIAPPGWRKDYDPLRDLHNSERGWRVRPGRGCGSRDTGRLPRRRNCGPGWKSNRTRKK